MGITRDTVAVALCNCLDLERSYGTTIAQEMTQHELMAVLNARRHNDGVELAGLLVPIVLGVELRAIDESDEAAVCAVIDRGRARMEAAQLRETTRLTCWPSSKASNDTSSCGPTINVLSCSEPSAAGPPIRS